MHSNTMPEVITMASCGSTVATHSVRSSAVGASHLCCLDLPSLSEPRTATAFVLEEKWVKPHVPKLHSVRPPLMTPAGEVPRKVVVALPWLLSPSPAGGLKGWYLVNISNSRKLGLGKRWHAKASAIAVRTHWLRKVAECRQRHVR